MLVGATVELGELVVGAGEADLEAVDLAEPAFPLRLGDAGKQVVADLFQARSLRWVWSQERTSDTRLSELSKQPEGPLLLCLCARHGLGGQRPAFRAHGLRVADLRWMPVAANYAN